MSEPQTPSGFIKHGHKLTPNPYLARVPYRKLLIACAALAAYSFIKLIFFDTRISEPRFDSVVIETWNKSRNPRESELESWDPMSAVVGPPTRKFRDNLRDDLKYVTSWPSAGWTNDVITFVNLIYLALITDRVPIIPAFTPSHVQSDVKTPVRTVPFGEVFDIPRLSKAIGRPVLQWEDVKNVTTHLTSDLETIGCWDLWQVTQYDEKFARRAPVTLSQLNLDVAYTTAPSAVKLIPNFKDDKHATFPAVAALSYTSYREKSLRVPLPSPILKESLHPDDHLLCFDYMYYMCSFTLFELAQDYSPAWRRVGQHMHWTPRLLDIADQYVRVATNAKHGEPTPNWIAVHVRHNDFAIWCGDVPVTECFAPISVIKRRIDEVKDELELRLGLIGVEVIVTSDEKDPKWWQEMKDLGYKTIDHSKTIATYGPWYPIFIDAVIQSTGVGAVGTHRSTMSAMAKLRVKSWKEGAVRTFKWGKLGADDHSPDDQIVDDF